MSNCCTYERHVCVGGGPSSADKTVGYYRMRNMVLERRKQMASADDLTTVRKGYAAYRRTLAEQVQPLTIRHACEATDHPSLLASAEPT